MRLYRVYGELATDALRDDPYVLTDPYFSADFSLVDAFALELDVAADDERRVEAGILFELSYNLSNGHTFIPQPEALRGDGSAFESGSRKRSRAGLLRLTEQERLVVDTVAGLQACYLPEFYEAETYITARLLQMAEKQFPEPSNVERLLTVPSNRRRKSGMPQPAAGRRSAAQRRQQLLIVTGGPGTGKTTVMSGILALFDALKIKTQLAAPTGRASKRLSEVTGRKTSTIHRLLEAQFDEATGMMSFYHDGEEPLNIDAMIVDETSMVDLQLMMSLLRALKPGCRLILVGDPDQLPSVGAGNVFSDLIRSGKIAAVRLTEIFRQAQQSLIVMNAHAVNRGELPDLSRKDRRTFFFMRRQKPGGAGADGAGVVCGASFRRTWASRRAVTFPVPSPTRKGETGTRALNLALQAVLDPAADRKAREKGAGEFSFREGDRVMQIRNNYDIMWKRSDRARRRNRHFQRRYRYHFPD